MNDSITIYGHLKTDIDVSILCHERMGIVFLSMSLRQDVTVDFRFQ